MGQSGPQGRPQAELPIKFLCVRKFRPRLTQVCLPSNVNAAIHLS